MDNESPEMDNTELTPEPAEETTTPSVEPTIASNTEETAEKPGSDDTGSAQPAQPEEPEKTAAEPSDKSAPGPGLSGIRVAMELCDRVMEAVGTMTFHGGVRPDNISVREDKVSLGGILRHGVGEFTPQELEYMAPELFWDGVRSPAADVYSVGLVLYSIYNFGRLPFWPNSGAVTPNARASALQKRMSDEPVAPPVNADAELSAVILRALSFRVEERWQDVGELKNALSSCDESSSPVDISLAMSGLLTRAAEVDPNQRRTAADRSRTYYDEGEIRDIRRPKRRKNLTWLWMLILSMLLIGAAVLLWISFHPPEGETPNGPPIEPPVTPTAEPLITPEPTPEPTPTERPHGAQYVVHVEDVSWEEAARRCEELGGTLAVPSSEEEYRELIRVCTSARINYVWLGASRQADGNWVSVNGDPVNFFNWGKGEPSFTDSGDGATEDYLMMWRVGETWPYNDSRENPLTDYGWIFGGSIGYVCKMW